MRTKDADGRIHRGGHQICTIPSAGFELVSLNLLHEGSHWLQVKQEALFVGS